jgi:hypothetical protein
MAAGTIYNAPLTDPPTLIAAGAGGAGVQDLGTLTAGAEYLVTLQNAIAADRGADPYRDMIEGWIKTGAAADVTVENGDPISVNQPVKIKSVTGKLRLSFIRNNDTPYACKVFVVRTDQ